MKKNKKKEESNPKNNKKSLSPIKNKTKMVRKSIPTIQKSDQFPKNANEFKHIMDDINCGVPDIEYMLQLRRYKKILNIDRNIPANSPSFYDDDFRKYKNKLNKKFNDSQQLLQTNIGRFRQLFSDRAKYAINDTQYKFEVTLRTNFLSQTKNKTRNNDNKEKQNILKNKNPWDSTNIPRSKSLFDTMLPPVLSRSKEIFGRLDDRIGRPLISIKRDGYINGEKVKKRVFEFNKNVALRYPSEHFPSSRYANDYGIQNIGTFKHLLNFDNKTMTSSWSTYLRGPKKIKILPEETKRREKRLRNITNDKIYPKS